MPFNAGTRQKLAVVEKAAQETEATLAHSRRDLSSLTKKAEEISQKSDRLGRQLTQSKPKATVLFVVVVAAVIGIALSLMSFHQSIR